jgi:hypothetical protein
MWTQTGPTGMDRSRLVRVIVRALLVTGAGAAIAFAVVAASDQFVHDAHAYWAADAASAYTIPEGSPDALLYAPPVILLFSPLGAIPWPAFAYAWTLLETAAIVVMAGPFTLPLVVTHPIATEITLGNIHALLGIAVIAGFRWPGAWALILLTKVTPGVGLLWFVFRREWRNLAIALGVTAAIAVPTMIVAPDLWVRWVHALTATAGGPGLASGILATPLPIRLALAVALLWWGARRDSAWVVPIAVTLGLPVLWDHGLAIALASIWLAMRPRFLAARPAPGQTLIGGPAALATGVQG